MSGHSKWAGIKHKKAKVDAQRGRIFTRVIREITVAARLGGGDPVGNPRLRDAMDKAKAANMPQDNIIRAVKKGTGELEGVSYEECIYEGYGPGGVAIFLEAVTDNRNRTTAEVRKLLSKFGGSMGESGCVGWMFNKKGLIQVTAKGVDEEHLLAVALEAGAEDVRIGEQSFEIVTDLKDFGAVKTALTQGSFPIEQAEITMVPQSTIRLEGKVAEQVLRLIDGLEEHDDVQHVYANFDIPEEIMAALTA
ncbi:MAG: YebC/PmpR family DNA-binding transcriptional regulator [candidate division NC10 bacterium]|nr:YebC/PmpR family DNA-binding transcriptional regulator [candidate division NC10 bacterium]